jgi:cytochrome c-type biogenesis protein CcmF
VVVQPLVSWLWVGGLVMAMGTVLAAFPGRRRNPIDPVSAPVTVSGTPAQAPAPREPEPEPEPVEVGS